MSGNIFILCFFLSLSQNAQYIQYVHFIFLNVLSLRCIFSVKKVSICSSVKLYIISSVFYSLLLDYADPNFSVYLSASSSSYYIPTYVSWLTPLTTCVASVLGLDYCYWLLASYVNMCANLTFFLLVADFYYWVDISYGLFTELDYYYCRLSSS